MASSCYGHERPDIWNMKFLVDLPADESLKIFRGVFDPVGTRD